MKNLSLSIIATAFIVIADCFGASAQTTKQEYDAEISYVTQYLFSSPEYSTYEGKLYVEECANGNLKMRANSIYMSSSSDELELVRKGNSFILHIPVSVGYQLEVCRLQYTATQNTYKKISDESDVTFSVDKSGTITLETLPEDVIIGDYVTDMKMFGGYGVQTLKLTPTATGQPAISTDSTVELDHCEYYDLNGRQLDIPQGVCIRKAIYTDSHTETTKIVIR